MQVLEVNGNNSKMFAQINLILHNLKFFFLVSNQRRWNHVSNRPLNLTLNHGGLCATDRKAEISACSRAADLCFTVSEHIIFSENAPLYREQADCTKSVSSSVMCLQTSKPRTARSVDFIREMWQKTAASAWVVAWIGTITSDVCTGFPLGQIVFMADDSHTPIHCFQLRVCDCI